MIALETRCGALTTRAASLKNCVAKAGTLLLLSIPAYSACSTIPEASACALYPTNLQYLAASGTDTNLAYSLNSELYTNPLIH